MFVTKKKHEAVVKELRRQIGVLTDNKRRMADALESEARHLRRQLDKMQDKAASLETELSTLKSARARSNGNLIPGGPKAKARAAAERGGVAS